jgi:MoaA/NifB/PqqE/SkfB family radical SAM enzyme
MPDDQSRAPLLVPEYPSRLLMDLRTDCNLKCPMCIVHGGTDDPRLQAFLRRNMSLENARRILDEVAAAKPMVQPNLWSEPTLAKDLEDQIRAMKERGLSVTMNTNGLLLKEKLARFFVEVELDSIAISIDAMTPETLLKVRGIDKLAKIHRAVETMLRIRGDREKPRIGVSFTLQPDNEHERDAFVTYWGPRVEFVRVAELFVDGRFPNMRPEGPRKPCPSLYSTLPVHVDGNAAICCLDGFGETKMGNVFEQGVKGVWHGEEFTKVRHYHETGQWDEVPFCKNCDRWSSHVFEEVEENGYLVRRSPEYTYYNRLDRLDNWSTELKDAHNQAEKTASEPVA